MKIDKFCNYGIKNYLDDTFTPLYARHISDLNLDNLISVSCSFFERISIAYEFDYSFLLDMDLIVIMTKQDFYNPAEPVNKSLLLFQIVAHCFDKPVIFIPLNTNNRTSYKRLKDKLKKNYLYINKPKRVAKALKSLGLNSQSKVFFMTCWFDYLSDKQKSLLKKYLDKLEEF